MRQFISKKQQFNEVIMTNPEQHNTEIEKYKIDKKAEVATQKLELGSNVIVGNLNLPQIGLLADKFANAGDLVPKEYQKSPEKCFVAIYKGASLGLDAFTSLQRIAVVNGRATLWGDTALALVRKSPVFEYIKEEVSDENGKLSAICIVKRVGEDEHTEVFTQDDAAKAKLWGKTGTWQTHPKRMLKYKARAFALRDVFADVLDGLYLKEEMEGEKINESPQEPRNITPLTKSKLDIVKDASAEVKTAQVNTQQDSIVPNVTQEEMEEAFSQTVDHSQNINNG